MNTPKSCTDGGRKRRLFIVSDIHGHYTAMKKALDEAGFDEKNENHVFVCCGDLFDRGRENRKVFNYVRRLKRKILICGNHDERLAEILAEKQIQHFDLYNGTDLTLEEFFGADSIDAYGRLTFPTWGRMAEHLLKFLDSMQDYFETEHYIFVHGWIPVELEGRTPRLLENWREANAEQWQDARFLEWQQLYGTPAMPEGKTLVCGHRMASFGRMFDPSRDPEDSGVFRGEGMIAIDACTVRSGRVNVLVLEDF